MSSLERWKETLCFLKTDPKGSIYKENQMGPRIESWGTPQLRGAEADKNSPWLTKTSINEQYLGYPQTDQDGR